jgi:hypothetical protein
MENAKEIAKTSSMSHLAKTTYTYFILERTEDTEKSAYKRGVLFSATF